MPMSEDKLLKRDAKRNLGNELLQSVKEMKAGKVGHTHEVEIPEIIEARNKIGFTQRLEKLDSFKSRRVVHYNFERKVF